jgi:ribose-phosphate pyrophosphokinase
MKPIVFPVFDETGLTQVISEQCDYEIGNITLHQFPDAETLVTINTDVKDRTLIFVASLNQPNAKILPLLFAAKTAKDLGAKNITLIAPYLAYMRQDKVFNPGEGITSRYFASLLSDNFNALITVDPHLHRWKSLSQIYSIPTQLIHAGKAIAEWIKNNISHPLIIGPDQESEQWIAAIAEANNAPYVIAVKTRSGDRDVAVTIPGLEPYHEYIPVLVDDIISTGKTLMSAAKVLQQAKFTPPFCIGIHAIFAGDSYNELLKSGIKKVVTCNTIHHFSNAIDLNPSIAEII